MLLQEGELQGELASRVRTVVKKTVGSSELSFILAEEQRKKTINSPIRPTRHPRFGGVYRQTDKVLFLFVFSFFLLQHIEWRSFLQLLFLFLFLSHFFVLFLFSWRCSLEVYRFLISRPLKLWMSNCVLR